MNSKLSSGLRAALLGGVGLAFVLPAMAQDAMETVVVTGIRGSLQRSLDIKRDAGGLVDAITMEDIGKFPDANLASALMRIPGVTITRAALGNGGAITTGEPTQITVRGLGPTFNTTLFEGRVIPSGIGGRAFDFSGLSADMVKALEVLKSPDPSMSAGAIGATVNVRYPLPFDYSGLKFATSISASYAPDDGRIRPNGNFLISDTFANNKVGVLLAAAYTSSAVTQPSFRNWGWIGQYIAPCQLATYTGPDCSTMSADTTKPNYNINAVADRTKPVWFTQDYAIYYDQTQMEKKNIRGAVQLQPNDSLLITLDANYSRSSVHQWEWVYAIWNNVNEMRKVKVSDYGTITDFERSAPTDFDANENFSVQQTYDFGINLKWNVNSNFTIVADYDQAMSALNPDNHVSSMGMDLGYGPSQSACTQAEDATCPFPVYTGGTNGMNVHVIQPGGHALPYYTGYGPNGDASQFLNYNIMGSHVMVVTAQRNRDLVNQAKLEGQWSDDTTTIKFGGNYITNHYKLQGYNSFDGNRWQIYSGYGPDSNNYFHTGSDPALDKTTPYPAGAIMPAGVHIPSSFFTGTINVRSIPGWDTINMIPGLPKFDAFAVYKYLNDLGKPTTPTSIPGFNWSCCLVNGQTTYTGTDLNQMMNRDPNGFQRVYEDTYAFYLSGSTDTKIGGLPLRINAGVRYEYTEVESSGEFRPLASMVISAADHTAYDLGYDPIQTMKVRSNYQYLLPNVDLILHVTDDLQVRVDASRTLTRPPLNNMTPNTSYGGRTGSLTATSGNPTLQPFLSDNLDMTTEWYYAPNSYVAGNAFLKTVSNFVVNSTSNLSFPNPVDPNTVIDPYTGQVAVFRLTAPSNGPNANVYGLEVAWQHMFGDSGFGWQINGTLVQTNKNYNPKDLTTSNFAMPGLADSANFVFFYDKDGFEIRVAANWRDTYLDHFGHSQGGTSFGTEPYYVNTAWSIDLSTRYSITDNIDAYFEVTNLNDQAFSSRGRYSDQVVDVVAYGRRFTTGIHFKL
jgi:TonB-dependent receptor